MKRNYYFYLSTIVFFFFFVCWILLLLFFPGHDSPYNDYFADSYGITAGLGGLLGLLVSKKYDGWRSNVGKSVILFSVGLLFQFFGQLSYTYLYYVYNIENAYPAFGEIFYVLSIPAYIVAIWNIARASGLTVTLKAYKRRAVALLIPVGMLVVSYMLFLRNYDTSDSTFSIVFLDYFYPIAQSLFISFALVTYFYTRNVLGGIMKNKVLFILFSLTFQYFADTLFIYETRSETWYAGGLSDLMFLISYYLMTSSFVKFSLTEISKKES